MALLCFPKEHITELKQCDNISPKNSAIASQLQAYALQMGL